MLSGQLLNQLVTRGSSVGSPMQNVANMQAILEGRRANERAQGLKTLGESLTLQDPNLQALAQVDPIQAMQMSGRYSTRGSRGVTGNMEIKEQNRKAAAEISAQIANLAQQGSLALRENPSADIRQVKDKIELLQAEYGGFTGGKRYKDQLTNEFERQLRSKADKRADVSQAEAIEQNVEKDVKQSIDTFKANNAKFLERVKQVEALESFVEEAKKGNPTARKNLLAGTSRLGSNEALSDSEFGLLLSANIKDRLARLGTMTFGDGAKIGNKEVNDVIRLLNSMYKPLRSELDSRITEYMPNAYITAGIDKGHKRFTPKYMSSEMKGGLSIKPKTFTTLRLKNETKDEPKPVQTEPIQKAPQVSFGVSEDDFSNEAF